MKAAREALKTAAARRGTEATPELARQIGIEQDVLDPPPFDERNLAAYEYHRLVWDARDAEGCIDYALLVRLLENDNATGREVREIVAKVSRVEAVVVADEKKASLERMQREAKNRHKTK